MQVNSGDYPTGTQVNFVAHVAQHAMTEAGDNRTMKVTGNNNAACAAITEDMAGLRKSVAAGRQQIQGQPSTLAVSQLTRSG